MSAVAEVLVESFVLLRLGERRFSLHASQVAELVAPSRIFRFPHKSRCTRRRDPPTRPHDRSLRHCRTSDRQKLDTRRFYLLATRKYGSQLDWIAVPVSGECELINVEMMAAGANDAAHVEGLLSHGGEVIEVLRLSALTPGPAESASASRAAYSRGGTVMMVTGRPAKILLIDTNVYFSKRLGDALKREGFEVTASTQPSFALTTLEYDLPAAIVCSTNMREMGALEIARLVRADSKNSALPIIALGDGSQRALMEAFQAGCDDYIDRQRPPAVIATHVKNIIVSKAEGFQPTQMLAQADTSLSGSLTHHDLPGVMQMLGHAHQTGALHINSGDTDALLFFDAGKSLTPNAAPSSATKRSSTFSRAASRIIPAFTNSSTVQLRSSAPYFAPPPISCSTPCANSTSHLRTSTAKFPPMLIRALPPVRSKIFLTRSQISAIMTTTSNTMSPRRQRQPISTSNNTPKIRSLTKIRNFLT